MSVRSVFVVPYKKQFIVWHYMCEALLNMVAICYQLIFWIGHCRCTTLVCFMHMYFLHFISC